MPKGLASAIQLARASTSYHEELSGMTLAVVEWEVVGERLAVYS